MQKPTTSTPHDAVFKKFLSHPETARDFLDAYLPASLHELCDLDTLKLDPGSFIEEDLRACYSDVLWSLKTTSGKGYIYALIEHQSSPDAHMAFRMMRYAIAAMQKHLDELVQKHIRERDLMVLVDNLVALLVKGYANDSQVETLFNYLMQSGSAPRFEAFIREVALRVPQHKERLMTIAECLRESGRRTGLLEGKLEGKQDEALRIAHAMLETGIDRELVLIITGLSSDELTASSD